MSLDLHLSGIGNQQGQGTFSFTGNSTSMGALSGVLTITSGFSTGTSFLNGSVSGTGSISGPFTGTVSSTATQNQILIDITIS